MSELLAPRPASVGTSPLPSEISPSARDLRLDFFRGLSLILIFVDHIPQNILGYFTLQSVQFFDAAEVFIFISGYTAAIVYGRALSLHGSLFASAQILRRAWQLYVAHIFLFMIFLAEVSYTVMSFNNPMYNEEMRVGEFLIEPHIAVIKALLLQFQPTFLDILPLYIVLLVAFPLVLIGLRLQPVIVILVSLALYIVVQFTDLSLPAYPAGREWYFNPLAWQFLFVAGAALSLQKDWVVRQFRAPALALDAGGGHRRRCWQHQAQLDDPRSLGPVPGSAARGFVAGRQNQPVTDTAHSVLCGGRARRGLDIS